MRCRNLLILSSLANRMRELCRGQFSSRIWCVKLHELRGWFILDHGRKQLRGDAAQMGLSRVHDGDCGGGHIQLSSRGHSVQWAHLLGDGNHI